ncbi:hypothetical protein DSO57_1016229 [Entomophthora muscae]|uniref:Uncharacterized protein n=1 Tax=Entomophthora muscae TaxID=34485 RepID=A0ACC2RJL7_9FUNG|nr:hypothetical protein DSO57_1016229 [Entomophthora muscae]
MSTKVSNKGKGGNSFSKYYTTVFGEERWDTLLDALKKPTRHCLIINKFSQATPTGIDFGNWLDENCPKAQPEPEEVKKRYTKSDWLSTNWPEHALGPITTKSKGDQLAFPAPSVTEDNLLSHYLLDAASLLPVMALDIQPSDHILDLCAAPGGKSVMIGQVLFKSTSSGETQNRGSLHSNEHNRSRYDRLKGVMASYFGSPGALNRPPIRISNLDGTMYGHFGTFQYDKILIDAPCSSERHLVHHSSEMRQWTPRQSVMNSQRQLKLLLSAIILVKPGGRIVYATCALTPEENDGVIGSLLARRGDVVVKVPFSPPCTDEAWGSPTKHGWMCLPDNSAGWGPIYLSILEKVSPVQSDSE